MQERFAGTLLTDEDYDILVEDDCTVLKPDGTPLLIYRKGVIPADACKAAYSGLRSAAIEGASDNRGMASGKGKVVGADIGKVTDTRIRPIKGDGTVSSSNYSLISTRTGALLKKHGGKLLMKRSDGTYEERQAKDVPSGVVGYMDGNPRFPYCRLTAFNINHPERFNAALPLIQRVDHVFAECLPDRYAAQQAVVKRTTPDFYISGTVFTTLTVNLSFQTAVHKDQGDLKQGFGVMAALRAGNYDGCYTCWPEYRVAANMQTGDVLLADVHEWHGNTPIKPKGRYERLSLVFYYREGIQECDTVEEELRKAKSKKGVTHMKGWKGK